MKVRELSRRHAHRKVATLMTCDDPRLVMGRPQLAGCIESLAPKVWEAMTLRFHLGTRLDDLTDRKIKFRPPKVGQRGVLGRIALSYRIEAREYRRRFTVRRSRWRRLTIFIGTI